MDMFGQQVICDTYGDEGKNYVFTEYQGGFMQDKLEEYLKAHAADFDCVAVMDTLCAISSREAALEHFPGPRILFRYYTDVVDNEDSYINIRLPGQPDLETLSDFERVVQEAVNQQEKQG